jgi:hypothetical protein
MFGSTTGALPAASAQTNCTAHSADGDPNSAGTTHLIVIIPKIRAATFDLHQDFILVGQKAPLIRAARISCYTETMEKTRQNVTLVVEEDLLLAARKVALDQRTSVNQLVREYLAALVEEPSRRRLARARLRKTFETGLVEVGDRKWSRDDLYDR